MEKIVLGVPYEITIEPSVDIGKFDCEIVLSDDEVGFAFELKPIKKSKNDYSFIVPSKLKELIGKKELSYSIFVYKENARFNVDDGKIKFIDEKDFKVNAKEDSKIRRAKDDESVEDNKETGASKEDKAPTPTPTPTPSSKAKEIKEKLTPEELAQRLIETQSKAQLKDEFKFKKNESTATYVQPKTVAPKEPVVEKKEETQIIRRQRKPNELQEIVERIERRNKLKELREK